VYAHQYLHNAEMNESQPPGEVHINQSSPSSAPPTETAPPD
jgi:hypothetical protein